MQNVIVYVEHTHGAPRRVSLEAATQGRALADKLGGKVHAVIAGKDGAKAQLTDLATPPARAKGQVLQAPDPAEGAKAIVQFLKDRKFL